MPDLIIVVNLAILVAIAFFFWKRFGAGSGRGFGNAIAKHIGLPRNTFWYLLDNGAKGSPLKMLVALEKSGVGLDQASRELGPSLQRGLERLEARFGTQQIYEAAKPIVARLVAESAQRG